ncbi:retrovirus-related pol polyprotein from transposon TNT 1-94 [Tanacetum coccineum]
MVPTLWSPTKVAYDKDAEKGIKHWGERRKLWHRSQMNKFSKHKVYSTQKIISVKSVSVKKLHGYGHLEEVMVKRANRHLYKFKEGDFVDLHLNKIEDMLILASISTIVTLLTLLWLFVVSQEDLVHQTLIHKVFHNDDMETSSEPTQTSSLPLADLLEIQQIKLMTVDRIVDPYGFEGYLKMEVKDLVHLPKNQSVIGTKWVFRNKLDENGIVSRNKERLVAQGYNQQKGIVYDETYAPVAKLESIRILLALACANDFKVYQMDVKSAFLNDLINEDVYVAQPLDFIDFGKINCVYKLKKALYGLNQYPKAWCDRLKAFLLKHKYSMGMVDNTLFTKK